MELDEALSQIAEIRHQMARTEVFRGYRALPVAFSGVLAISAAVVQAVWLPNPTERIGAYLGLWVGSAVVERGGGRGGDDRPTEAPGLGLEPAR